MIRYGTVALCVLLCGHLASTKNISEQEKDKTRKFLSPDTDPGYHVATRFPITNNLAQRKNLTIKINCTIDIKLKNITQQEHNPIAIPSEEDNHDYIYFNKIRLTGPSEIIQAVKILLKEITSGRPITKLSEKITKFLVTSKNSDDFLTYLLDLIIKYNPSQILPLLQNIKQSNNDKLPVVWETKLLLLIKNNEFDMSDDLFEYIFKSILKSNSKALITLLENLKEVNNDKILYKLKSKLLSFFKNNQVNMSDDMITYILELFSSNTDSIIILLKNIHHSYNGKIPDGVILNLIMLVRNNKIKITDEILIQLFDIIVTSHPNLIIELIRIKHLNYGKISEVVLHKFISLLKEYNIKITEEEQLHIFEIMASIKPNSILELLETEHLINVKIPEKVISKLISLVKEKNIKMTVEQQIQIFDVMASVKPILIVDLLMIEHSNKVPISIEVISKFMSLVKIHKIQMTVEQQIQIFDIMASVKSILIVDLLMIEHSNKVPISIEVISKFMSLVKIHNIQMTVEQQIQIFDIMASVKHILIVDLLMIEHSNKVPISIEVISKFMSLVKIHNIQMTVEQQIQIFDIMASAKPSLIVDLLMIEHSNKVPISIEVISKFISLVKIYNIQMTVEQQIQIFEIIASVKPNFVIDLLKIEHSNNIQISEVLISKLMLLVKNNSIEMSDSVFTDIYNLLAPDFPNYLEDLFKYQKNPKHRVSNELLEKILGHVRNCNIKTSYDKLIIELLTNIKKINNGHISSEIMTILFSIVNNMEITLSDDIYVFIFNLLAFEDPNQLIKFVKAQMILKGKHTISPKLKLLMLSLQKHPENPNANWTLDNIHKFTDETNLDSTQQPLLTTGVPRNTSPKTQAVLY